MVFALWCRVFLQMFWVTESPGVLVLFSREPETRDRSKDVREGAPEQDVTVLNMISETQESIEMRPSSQVDNIVCLHSI